MKLEQQVTNKEISQRLKELGVKQESLFYHFFDSASGGGLKELEPLTLAEIQEDELDKDEEIEIFSAFTVAELGEMLKNVDLNYWYSYPDFRLQRATEATSDARDEKEADARGKMLIYLLENKLITL